uniref:Uncharacterized protein n=1 Tax=Romanomermis culicivorax TaxID=13658 RepID=A0A915JNB6_ROMCU
MQIFGSIKALRGEISSSHVIYGKNFYPQKSPLVINAGDVASWIPNSVNELPFLSLIGGLTPEKKSR